MLGLFRNQILGIDLKVGRFGFKMIGVLSKIGGWVDLTTRRKRNDRGTTNPKSFTEGPWIGRFWSAQ